MAIIVVEKSLRGDNQRKCERPNHAGPSRPVRDSGRIPGGVIPRHGAILSPPRRPFNLAILPGETPSRPGAGFASTHDPDATANAIVTRWRLLLSK